MQEQVRQLLKKMDGVKQLELEVASQLNDVIIENGTIDAKLGISQVKSTTLNEKFLSSGSKIVLIA